MDNYEGDRDEKSEHYSYLRFGQLNNLNNLRNNVNDNFNFQNIPTMATPSSAYHNYRMQSIKSTLHIANTVEQYSNVTSQLKSTFNQISNRQSNRQSISASSTSSTESSTSSSLPSSIVEIIEKSSENLFILKSAEDLLKSEEIIDEIKLDLQLKSHDNLYRCLSITDESLELNNLLSSSSSLDSSFENIYSLFPINKRTNSINKSKTSQALIYANKEEDSRLNEQRVNRAKSKSLSDKKCFRKEINSNLTSNENKPLIKQMHFKDKVSLNCHINLIELNLKDSHLLTITIKWPLKSADANKKKLFSIQVNPIGSNDQLLNVHIKY